MLGLLLHQRQDKTIPVCGECGQDMGELLGQLSDLFRTYMVTSIVSCNGLTYV